jgi:serine/threonine protein kinase
MYELIVGLPPYYNAKKEVLFENIKRGPLKLPKALSFEAKDIIKKLLCRDPKKRLGAIKDSE